MVNPKNISPEALELLKQIEGYYEVPTEINGTLYIGYGFSFYDNGDPVTPTDLPLPPKQSSRMLRHFLKPFENCVSAVLRVRVSQSQYDALVLLAYDIGIRNFCRSGLLTKINSHEKPQNLAVEWSLHANCEGQFNFDIQRVRDIEYHLYCTSEINLDL